MVERGSCHVDKQTCGGTRGRHMGGDSYTTIAKVGAMPQICVCLNPGVLSFSALDLCTPLSMHLEVVLIDY